MTLTRVSVVLRSTVARRSSMRVSSAQSWVGDGAAGPAQPGGTGVGAQPFFVGDRRDVGRQGRGGRGVQLDHGDPLLELRHREALREARGAAGGQHVVAAGGVVGERRRGVAADEDGAGVADQRDQRGRLAQVQLEVLRGELVAQRHGSVAVGAGHEGDVVVGEAELGRERRDGHRDGTATCVPPMSARHAMAPEPCSACASRSAASHTGSADSSAITSTSLGPASASMPTCPMTCRLASVT